MILLYTSLEFLPTPTKKKNYTATITVTIFLVFLHRTTTFETPIQLQNLLLHSERKTSLISCHQFYTLLHSALLFLCFVHENLKWFLIVKCFDCKKFQFDDILVLGVL